MSASPTTSGTWPVTLAFLLGPGERENLVPFFLQFRGWGGEVVVVDDDTRDGSAAVLQKLLGMCFDIGPERLRLQTHSLNGDFATARNRLQQACRTPWILMTDPDERWDERLIGDLPALVTQLERDGKLICGFPRANFIDGVLVNDLASTHWTEEGLISALPRTSWPPENRDTQYRLLRSEERWVGRLHERPARLSSHSEGVVSLNEPWIVHNKSYAKQRRQDALYKSLGQSRGMPVTREREISPRIKGPE